MTDADLNTRLTRMETSLRHIERDMQEAKEDRRKVADKMDTFGSRLTLVEAADRTLADIPRRVSKTEAENSIQNAVREERAHTIAEVRKLIFGGFAVAGTLASIIAIVAGFFLGGNG